MRTADWLNDERTDTLPRRVERVITAIQRHLGALCARCGGPLCGHLVVMSVAAGFEDAPRCLGCLAAAIGRARDDVRDQLAGFILGKDCLTQGWRLASLREGTPADAAPPCLWTDGASLPAPASETLPSGSTAPAFHVEWDAGDLSCGDLALDLRLKLERMTPGHVLKLVSRDAAAPEDVPAWCRLTGNPLLHASPPHYWIRRKD